MWRSPRCGSPARRSATVTWRVDSDEWILSVLIEGSLSEGVRKF